jgi:hypothetical protein
MQKDNKIGDNIRLRRAIVGHFNTYKYAFIFAATFLVVSFLYLGISELHNYPAISQNPYWNLSFNAFQLFTSPFSPSEDISPHITFSQIETNLFLNFYYVFLAILSLEVYYNWIKKKNTIRILFYLSVAASYLTSISWWIIRGTPSTGTSIIGLIFSFAIVYVLIINAKRVWKKANELKFKARLIRFTPKKYKKHPKEIAKLLFKEFLLLSGYLFTYVIMFLLGLPGYFLASNAQSLSSSVPVHLTGLSVFLVLFFLNKKFNSSIFNANK